jgi:YVTN family beta-propeller protein
VPLFRVVLPAFELMGNRAGRGRAGRLLGRFAAVLLGAACLLAPQVALAGTAYVVNDGESTVTPINTATNMPGTPIIVKGNPVGVAITPDGKTAYVGSYGSVDVTPIDTATNAVEAGIPIGNLPEVIAITPDGSTAYVASVGVNRITPIDVATNTAEESITVGDNPSGIAIMPDGKTAYVTNDEGVTPIDTATNTAGSPINVGEGPEGIAITPDGKTAYVTNELGSTVTPIDIATNTPGAPIKVGSHPNAVAITPDGKTAYVTNDGGTSVTPINVATNTPGTPIAVGSHPFAVAITPDGKTAFVTNENGASVTPIDIATNTPGTPITVGENPEGIAITPDQPPLAAFSATSATLGRPTSFDASASVDPDGSVAAYSWSFGDGSTLVTTAPTTSHTYTAAATYTATLTLTDNEGCSTAFVFTGQTALCDGSPGASTTRQVTVAAAPVQLGQSRAPAPDSNFSVLSTKVDKKTGAITFTATVSDPGTFTATLSFRNGKFGVFSATKRIACKKGQVRLRGKCRPATVRFGSIRKTVAAAGIVVFTLTPSVSATKALKQALEKQHGLGVTALLSYQSARGGSPASRTVPVEDKLAKPKTKRAK